MPLRSNLTKAREPLTKTIPNRLDLTLIPYEKPALQILNWQGKRASSLAIANLHDSLQTPEKGSLAFSKFYPEQSNDRFYLQYENPELAGKGFIIANIESSNPLDPDDAYRDSTLIYLYEDSKKPGMFHSKPIVLVSNRSFDSYQLNGHKDNQPEDQTILAELGSQITVSYQDTVSGKKEMASVPVPIKKVMEVQPFLVRDREGKLLATEADAKQKITLMQESLAPAGVKVEVLPEKIIDLPRGIKLEDGLSPRELKKIARDTAKFYPPDQGLRLIMTGETPLLQGKAYGTSYTKLFKKLTLKIENAMFVANHSAARTPAHEVGHCLFGTVLFERKKAHQALGHNHTAGYHHANPLNLMSHSPTAVERRLWGSEHWTDAQIEVLLQSPLLKDPASRPKVFQKNQSIYQALTPNDNRLVLNPLGVI